MYFKYGTYQHPDNEVNVTSITARRRYSPRHRLFTTVWTLTARGEIITDEATSDGQQDAIKQRIAELQQVYADDGEDVGLFHDDGGKSGHYLNSLNSINGVSVIEMKWPTGQKAEYATQRTFELVFQAEYLNVESQILYFEESLQFFGTGGPKWRVRDTVSGPVIVRPIYPKTAQTIIQSGRAIGLQGYPLIPVPLFPSLEHEDLRVTRYGSPRSYRNTYLEYPAHWQYRMTSPVGVSGVPGRDLG